MTGALQKGHVKVGIVLYIDYFSNILNNVYLLYMLSAKFILCHFYCYKKKKSIGFCSEPHLYCCMHLFVLFTCLNSNNYS